MEQNVLHPAANFQELDHYFHEVGTKKCFLICGTSLQKLRLGLYFETLENRTGVQVVQFSDFRPNPLYEEALEAAKAFRASGCDTIVAVGGGSAIDVAKCVKLWTGMDLAQNCLNQEIVPNEIPFLAVPTTAGTGSEVTHFAVIYYQGKKQSLSHENCIPSAALLDPSTLESLPDYYRKSSMLDALCHGVESFWSLRATAESRNISRQAIQAVWENVDGYLANIPEGNSGMLEAAHLAGMAIDRAQTTAGHAMCYKLTSLYGLAHGHAAALCVAKLWPYIVAKAKGTALERVLQDLAKTMDCGTILESVRKFQNLLNRLELETPVPNPEHFEILKISVNPIRLKNNPISLNLEDIDWLYHQIL